jgi:hypothetical protein
MATIHPFGTSAEHTEAGYRLITTVTGPDTISDHYPDDVLLVRGATIHGRPGDSEFYVLLKEGSPSINRVWADQDSEAAQQQGWDIFETGKPATPYELQADDDAGIFATDTEAQAYVLQNAQEGDLVANKALTFLTIHSPAEYTAIAPEPWYGKSVDITHTDTQGKTSTFIAGFSYAGVYTESLSEGHLEAPTVQVEIGPVTISGDAWRILDDSDGLQGFLKSVLYDGVNAQSYIAALQLSGQR